MLNRHDDSTPGWPHDVVRELLRELESQAGADRLYFINREHLLRVLQDLGAEPREVQVILVRYGTQLLTINETTLRQWAELRLDEIRKRGSDAKESR